MKKIWILSFCASVLYFDLRSIAFASEAYSAPLEAGSWTQVSFNRIPPNVLKFVEGSMEIQVMSSASPIVHKLPAPMKVKALRVQARVIGSRNVEKGEVEEDSFLRVGLVAVGTQKLSGVKKLFAADWVKKLFELAPSGAGLDKIHFFNVTDRKEFLGKKRTHPASELLSEEVVALAENGVVDFTKTLNSPLETAAIWLSIDGDDSKSNFTLVLQKLELIGQ